MELLKKHNIDFHESNIHLTISPSLLHGKSFKDVINILSENNFIDTSNKEDMIRDIDDCYKEPSMTPKEELSQMNCD